MSETTGTAAQQARAAAWRRRARGALGRYRVMAWITGCFLLLLCLEMILNYVVHAPDGLVDAIAWIPFAHGWIYVVYLVTVLDLWSTMRWGFPRLAGLVLAGVVPVLSFVMERRVHVQVGRRIAAAEQALAGQGRTAPDAD